MDRMIIEANQLTKVYDGQSVVDQLSLSIKEGEIFGLLGPNGAGKSTTILMMLGLIEPTEGHVYVNGVNSTSQPIHVKRHVGYLPDNLGFYHHMTGLENLLYTAALNGISRNEAEKRAKDLLELVGLEEDSNKKTGKYSRGMKQRLGLADVLIKNPDIIILDEPTLGIDPEGVREILQLIKTLNKEQHLTVLLSSHHLHQVQQICDRVGIFVEGKLIAKGYVNELVNQLFSEDAYIVNVETTPLNEDVIKMVESIKGVNRVKRVNDRGLEVYCHHNVSSQIAKKLITQDIELHYIHKKDYGLDEIYHRYFEGSEET